MRHGIGLGLLLVLLGMGLPANVHAQWRCDNCCKKCRQPAPQCACQAVHVVPQISYQPVVETQHVTRPVMTQRDVVETRYRAEAYNETIPTTAYENVTVDEGGYQTVYVPKMVTKQVAKTVYQNRTSYRTVPYQVTRRVSECASQTVPVQTIRYVPTTAGTILFGAPTTAYSLPPTYAGGYPVVSPAPVTTAWQPTPAFTPTPAPTSTAYVPTPAPAAYVPEPYEPRPAPISRHHEHRLAPVPDPRFSQQEATPIYRRTAYSTDAFGAYEPVVAEPLPPVRHAERGSSLFAPAPSAATVWRANGPTYR